MRDPDPSGGSSRSTIAAITCIALPLIGVSVWSLASILGSVRRDQLILAHGVALLPAIAGAALLARRRWGFYLTGALLAKPFLMRIPLPLFELIQEAATPAPLGPRALEWRIARLTAQGVGLLVLLTPSGRSWCGVEAPTGRAVCQFAGLGLVLLGLAPSLSWVDSLGHWNHDTTFAVFQCATLVAALGAMLALRGVWPVLGFTVGVPIATLAPLIAIGGWLHGWHPMAIAPFLRAQVPYGVPFFLTSQLALVTLGGALVYRIGSPRPHAPSTIGKAIGNT